MLQLQCPAPLPSRTSESKPVCCLCASLLDISDACCIQEPSGHSRAEPVCSSVCVCVCVKYKPLSIFVFGFAAFSLTGWAFCTLCCLVLELGAFCNIEFSLSSFSTSSSVICLPFKTTKDSPQTGAVDLGSCHSSPSAPPCPSFYCDALSLSGINRL